MQIRFDSVYIFSLYICCYLKSKSLLLDNLTLSSWYLFIYFFSSKWYRQCKYILDLLTSSFSLFYFFSKAYFHEKSHLKMFQYNCLLFGSGFSQILTSTPISWFFNCNCYDQVTPNALIFYHWSSWGSVMMWIFFFDVSV